MGTIMDTISQLLNLWLKLCQNGNYRKNKASLRQQKYEKSNNHKDNKIKDSMTTNTPFSMIELIWISVKINHDYRESLSHQHPHRGCCYQHFRSDPHR